MSIVYFTSVNNLKESTTIDLNVEDKLLESAIWDAQNIDIQPILGTRLYKSLQNKITGETLSGETYYKDLMDDYIEPTLLKFAERRSLLWLYAKIRNKSIVNQESDNSIAVEIGIVDKMKQELLDDAEFYSNRLKEYLCEYDDRFPEYKDDNPDSLEHYLDPNQDDSYFSGIYLNDYQRRKTYKEKKNLNEE